MADLDAYLDLIQSERYRRPSETLLADEIRRLRADLAHVITCIHFGCERCLGMREEVLEARND